jgi:4-diphosphocytidyl-2-C-methyl-D-erythritol kinase
MVSFPPCKINLGLHVLRKRSDNYHELDTCFYPIPFTDILEIIPSETFEFTSSGVPVAGDPAANLCVKAYQLLQQQTDLPPVKIHLHKIIPMGAGLGGGSSDGAHTLRVLNQVFKVGMTQIKLQELAAKLGSDCAFFLYDQPMIGTGRGEILAPATVTLSGKYLVLINPGIHVSTAEAYAALKPGEKDITVNEILQMPIDNWKDLLVNDFEESVFTRYAAIKNLKEQLYQVGARYASMSGSGSTVFGVFDEEPELKTFDVEKIVWRGKL